MGLVRTGCNSEEYTLRSSLLHLVYDYIISRMNLTKNIFLLFQKSWNHARENNNSKEFNMFRSTSVKYAENNTFT